MIRGLEEVINEFSNEIKDKFADYVALYNSLCQFLQNEYREKETTVEVFLKHDFSRENVIDSCVWYIRNSSKANSVTAIEKYLNAITKFYNQYMLPNGYDNRSLYEIVPFGQLKPLVKERLKNEVLKEKETIEPIGIKEVAAILDYFASCRKSLASRAGSIISKLILLYGFKLEKIRYFEKGNFSEDGFFLNINLKNNDWFVQLELPKELAYEIQEYFRMLGDIPKNQLIFLNMSGKVITSTFLDTYLSAIRLENENLKRLTATGMAKYAIMNMIEAGFSKLNIKYLTGMEDAIINDCEERLFERKSGEKEDYIRILNRDVNSRIRGIATYDLL